MTATDRKSTMTEERFRHGDRVAAIRNLKLGGYGYEDAFVILKRRNLYYPKSCLRTIWFGRKPRK